jgi:phosphate transport system substrate-binding protein
MTNAPGDGAYPIAATVFILMYKQPKDVQHSQTALEFFKWALDHGQEVAQKLDYVPLPPALVSQVESYVGSQIHTQ